ncbi:DMT family transporter [Candidatus Raskinella chloraquaticus]|uniref:DMT family transporter n=1 Tax=Candidatus Raskinella chloraquaticus TaxID=1951219 RepID=UPI00367315DE
MVKRTGVGLAAALAAGIAYGSNAPFATLASRLGVPGSDAVLWRALLMLALTGGFALLARQRLKLRSSDIAPVLGLGLATGVTSIAYLSSVAFIPVSVAAILFYTYPLVILLLNPLIEGTPHDVSRLAIFAFAFLGIVLVVGPGFSALDIRGLGLALLASLGATAMFYFSARAMTSLTPASAAFWVHVIILPAALLVVLLTGGPVALPATPAFAGIFAVICGSYISGYVLQLLALSHISPAVAGLIFLAEPAVAILTAAVVLDERLTLTQGFGCIIVFTALVAATLLESWRQTTVS